MVGIALLTLVPGELGGSETYVARAVARARAGRRARLPRAAAAGCARGARRASVRGRDRVPRGADDAEAARRDVARDGAAGAAARAARRRRRRALPADAADPDRAQAVGGLAARPAAPRPALAVPALGAGVPRRRVAPVGARRRPGDHDQRVRARPRGRAARARPGARRIRSISGSTTSASRPDAAVEREPFLLYPARRWPHKNHERLFEAFALAPAGAAGAAARADGRRARGRGAGRRRGAGQRAGRRTGRRSTGGRPRSSSRRCTRASASRRSRRWPAAARSRAPTSASLPEVVGDAARLFDPTDPGAIAAGVLDVLAAPDEWSARGLERARASRGRRRPAPTRTSTAAA